MLDFWRDGLEVMTGVASQEWQGRLRAAVEHYLDQADRPISDVTAAHDGTSGRFVFGNSALASAPELETFLEISSLWRRVSLLFGAPAPEVTLLDDQIYVKEPETLEVMPWHQDVSFWAVSGVQLCTVWLAVDDVHAETGGLEFVRGSHLWGRTFEAIAPIKDDRLIDPCHERVPDDATLRRDFEIVSPSLQAGDAVVFHASTLHGSGPNRSRDARRRAFVTRWAGSDVRYLPRTTASPRQIAKANANGVRPGDRFRGPSYRSFSAAMPAEQAPRGSA